MPCLLSRLVGTVVDPRDRRCRIANRRVPACGWRMVYQLVGGRQVWRGKGVHREYLLAKQQEFHRVHKTPIEQSIRDLNEAFAWLPRSAYAAKQNHLKNWLARDVAAFNASATC